MGVSRRSHFIAAIAGALVLTACANAPPTADARNALAPTGTLRAAMLAGSPTHAAAPEIGRELARRLGVAFEAVTYKGDGALMASVALNDWDIIFTANDPERAKVLDLAPAYASVETGYLIRAASNIASSAQVDRSGVRIAVHAKGSADRLVTPIIKSATVVRVGTAAEAIELLPLGKVDVVVANKTNLFPAAEQIPGARVLEGGIGTTRC